LPQRRGWRMPDIVLINPKFEMSFWGIEHALPLLGKRANMPVAALPLLAALTPSDYRVTLIDENVQPIDFDRCARADIVGVTGMIVQRRRMGEILSELKRRGAYTVVGGPWISVKEDYFDGLVDVIFVGEAEQTWPQFLADWRAGKPSARYEQSEPTDMSQVPAPRLDLLKMNRYAFASVQFTRGCPFLCEFCDIIVIFGRKPRLKTPQQIIRELEALRSQHHSIVFIVDDNLIGNKKAIKGILRHVIDWQRANGYPLVFFTEASLDLADDDELMRLMVEANISALFIGIESPNLDALRETHKLQNVRGGGSMVDKVRRIQDTGIEVWAGMILGFDNDDPTIFKAQQSFLEQARISMAMIGMLSAIPRTPLHARLAAAGRLDSADDPAFGTNVIPLQMSRAELSEGYIALMAALYEPRAFFQRVDDLFVRGNFEFDRGWQRYAMQHPGQRWLRHSRFWLQAWSIMIRVMIGIPEGSLRRVYWVQFWHLVTRRRNASAAKVYALKCAFHYHMHRMVLALIAQDRAPINTF
jgi:radical SAM superfamily enzyme YgiQ (UPF0313 family)